MSVDSSLINLDRRVVIDAFGGRHLPWLIDKFKGERLVIDNDGNAGMDGFVDEAVKLGFREYSADDFVEYWISGTKYIVSDLIDSDFFTFRRLLDSTGKYLCMALELNDGLQSNEFMEVHNAEDDDDFPWFKCKSLKDFCKGLEIYVKDGLIDTYSGKRLTLSLLEEAINSEIYFPKYKDFKSLIEAHEGCNTLDLKKQYEDLISGKFSFPQV